MYEHDERIVMTLDAGGTNFVFSAIQGCREIVEPICLPAASDDLERCLSVLVEGFLEVEKRLPKLPVAISFAFPGPADTFFRDHFGIFLIPHNPDVAAATVVSGQ
jgi:glucokinase